MYCPNCNCLNVSEFFLLYLFIKNNPILTKINEYNATNIYADITPNVPTKAY